MSIKIAVLGASYLQKPLYEKLRELNYTSIAISWDVNEVCVKEGLVDKFHEVSIVEKEKVLQICQDENIDGIISIASDVAVPVMAYVAEKMNLAGNSIESSVWSTNKNEMRKRFAKYNLPIPQFSEVFSLNDAKNFLSNTKKDLIIKPADRSGSLGVQLVPREHSNEELSQWVDTAINSSFSKTAIIEEFIVGREISVEYISFKGEHYFLNTTDKVTSGSPHYVEIEQHQPALINENILDDVKKIVPKALNALGITIGASHTELLIDHNNKIWITEVGSRMGGDFIGSNLTKLSTGYDFVEAVINLSLGDFSPPEINKSLYSGVLFYSEKTKHILPLINSENDPRIVEKKVTSEEVVELKKSSDRGGYLIYQSNKRFKVE